MTKKPGYDYILLDWDGNLAKTLDIWEEAFQRATEKNGFDTRGGALVEAVGSIKEHLHSQGLADPQGIVDEAEKIAMELLPEAELYPDALEVLLRLRNMKKRLALVTTSSHRNVMCLLEKYELVDLFDVIVTHNDTKKHKPHAEPLEKALELLNGEKHRTVMIGDSDKDLGAALSFGIDSILFYPPEHEQYYDLEKLRIDNPTHVVDDFRKILDIV